MDENRRRNPHLYEVDDVNGLDYFGADDLLGFEAMDLAKMGTGLLSGFGGMFGGGGGGGAATGAQAQNAQAAADARRLEDEKRKAEQSANNMKIALGVGGALAAVVLFVVTRK